MRLIGLIVAGLALAATVMAQTVYRYVTPDGRVIYSDTPVPGARRESTLAPPPPASTVPPASAPPEARQAREKAADDRATKAAAVEGEVRAAARALEEAKAKLAAGRDALPGERTGTARGGSRLNEEYEARQQALQKAVADAQARLDRAVAAERSARRGALGAGGVAVAVPPGPPTVTGVQRTPHKCLLHLGRSASMLRCGWAIRKRAVTF